MKKIQHSKGDILNSCGTVYIKEDTEKSKQKKRRYVFVKCPYCEKIFSTAYSNIKVSKLGSCGCKRKPPSQKGNYTHYPGDRLGPHNILLLERIDNKTSKVRCECPVCHRTDWITYLYNIIKPNNPIHCCRSCANKEIMSQFYKEYREEILNKKFGKLTVIDILSNHNGHSILYKCLCDCKNITYVRRADLISGNTKSCGKCNKHSIGEEIIQSFLIQNKINFDTQKQFDDCVNLKTKHKLRFDFYLPNHNCCIEYDGIQHFEPREYFGGEEEFKKIQERDNIKNQYCKDNNIKLIRIPYTEKNIEQRLLDEIFS